MRLSSIRRGKHYEAEIEKLMKSIIDHALSFLISIKGVVMSNNELLIPNASWYHYIGTSSKKYDSFFQSYQLYGITYTADLIRDL